MRSILICDGNNLLHRTMKVPNLAMLATKDGRRLGAAYGFLKSLRKALDSGGFTKCVVCWDAGKSSRRLNLFAEYKDNRNFVLEDFPVEKQAAALADKQEYFARFNLAANHLDAVFTKLGVHQCSIDGKEADDVIYQVRKHTPSVGGYLVQSEDKDFYQLVDDSTDLHRPIADKYYTKANFKSMIGVEAEHAILWKAMLGDGSDGIPGIKGVGEKTAADIVNANPTSSLQEIQDYCLASKSKKIQLVGNNWSQVLLNLKLMALDREVFEQSEIDSIKEQVNRSLDKDLIKALGFMHNMEFFSITKNWFNWSTPFMRLL